MPKVDARNDVREPITPDESERRTKGGDTVFKTRLRGHPFSWRLDIGVSVLLISFGEGLTPVPHFTYEIPKPLL